MRALVKHFFGSAFGEKDRFALRTLNQDRHHGPREVERDLVQLLVLLHQRLLMEFGAIKDSPVKQVS